MINFKAQLNKGDLWETIKYVYQSMSPLSRLFFTITLTIAVVCNYSMYLLFLFCPDYLTTNEMLLVCTTSLFAVLIPSSIRVLTLLAMERKAHIPEHIK